MFRLLFVVSVLGWSLKCGSGYQPNPHMPHPPKFDLKAENTSEYKFPTKPTFELGNQSQVSAEAPDNINNMAPGKGMNTSKSQFENTPTINVMPGIVYTPPSASAQNSTKQQPTTQPIVENEPNLRLMTNPEHITSSMPPAWVSSKGPPIDIDSAIIAKQLSLSGVRTNTMPTILNTTTSVKATRYPEGTTNIQLPNEANNNIENRTSDRGKDHSQIESNHKNSNRSPKDEKVENVGSSSSALNKGDPDDTEHEMPGHRTPRHNDLCSACLCDPLKRNIICKHEHLYNGASHHLTLRKEIIPQNATTLQILNFELLTILNGTFSSENLELRKIVFENIGMVELFKESLFFNGKAKENREAVVIFTRCNIKEIPRETVTQYSRSEDQNNDINLEDTRFLTLEFHWCNISTIRSYALFQARLLFFRMSYTKVNNMETNCIHLDVYDEWLVENCNLPKFVKNTICLRAQMTVIFSRNAMAGLENRSLDITSSNQVLFEYNFVSHLGPEALMGIRPSKKGRGANIVFLNNTVTKVENKSLAISKAYPIHERKVLDNRFNIVCDCKIHGTFKQLLGISGKSDYDDELTYQSVIEKSRCQRFAHLSLYKNVKDYYNENCMSAPIAIIASATTVIIVIIITIIVCVVCTRRAEKAKEEANYLGECCFSHSFSTLHSNIAPLSPGHSHQCQSFEYSNTLQPWIVAVPEVKTYQEAEVNVHYENTEPMNVSLRGSYPEPQVELQRRVQVRASCPFN